MPNVLYPIMFADGLLKLAKNIGLLYTAKPMLNRASLKASYF